MVRFLVGLASLATLALADITFNCIGYPTTKGNTFGVSINNVITKLTTNETIYPVWTGTVPGTTGDVQFSYVELSSSGTTVKLEPFTRKLNQTTDTRADNEFFMRPVTRHPIVRLPYTYLATYPSKSKAFKEDQVATIHLTAPATNVSQMNQNPESEVEVRVVFRFINAKTIYTQNNITLKTAGKSSKGFAKQAYKLSFDTDYNQTFFSRPNIKLRAMGTTEPTMMREKMYIDMLNSVGVPTQQGSYIRLFINDEPYGLYLMVDDIKRSFLKQTVYGGDPTVIPGSLIQCNAPTREQAADLAYKGPTGASYNKDIYISQNLGNNPVTEPLQQLIAFMLDLQNFNPTTTPDPINYFNGTRLELDGFLRNMALEYLMGGFDNYWIGGSNYFIYFNPALGPSGKWQWIPTDFDGTFGCGSSLEPTDSYTNVTNFAIDHPLVSKLIIKNKEINALFVKILTEIIQTAFKPEAMNPHIDSVHAMISPEAEWDISLTRHSPGTDNKYTFQEFNENLVNITRDMNGALKPWVQIRAETVSKELGFTIPAGTADRVPPPPRGGDDDDDDKKGGSGNGHGGNGAGSLTATGLATVAALVSALVLLA